MGAYETKVIIRQMAEIIVRSETLEDAYTAIADSAKDEGVTLPSYKEKREKLREINKKATN